MAGVFNVAGLFRIELGFGSADFANESVEVGRLFLVPDEGKHEFLDGHLDLLCAEHIRSRIPGKRKTGCRWPGSA
jgi:hypothetical protein